MKDHSAPKALSAYCERPLSGSVKIPGDKSISHRALIIGSLAIGETKIYGLLESADVLNTVEALRAFGVNIIKKGTLYWKVDGVGTGGFREPNQVIDFGNSGTSARLILGATATTPITATVSGDASLVKRPMDRVIRPLSLFGANFLSRRNGLLPLTIEGTDNPVPIEYKSPVASAQVKSAILLAGLNSPGRTIFWEPSLSRDHTEKMLIDFGGSVKTENIEGNSVTTLIGECELIGRKVFIPRDPSSAAFLIAAALLVTNSDVTIPNVSQNPTRNGFLKTLIEMGADISLNNHQNISGEQFVDINVKSGALRGVDVPPERATSMIDEYPILAVIAAAAEGKTRMFGLEELTVKESNRIAAMETGLRQCGIKVESGKDFMIVEGCDKSDILGGTKIVTHYDHRIAMSFLCLGLVAKDDITIDDSNSIFTSFPNFFDLMKEIGVQFKTK